MEESCFEKGTKKMANRFTISNIVMAKPFIITIRVTEITSHILKSFVIPLFFVDHVV
jgi:hypothetical protein